MTNEDIKGEQMTIGEIKAIEPLAEVHELKPHVRYIVQLRGRGANQKSATKIADGLKEKGLDCIVVAGDVTFYEIAS